MVEPGDSFGVFLGLMLMWNRMGVGDDIAGDSGSAVDGGPATRIAAVLDAERCESVGEVSAVKSNTICVGDIGAYGRNVFD